MSTYNLYIERESDLVTVGIINLEQSWEIQLLNDRYSVGSSKPTVNGTSNVSIESGLRGCGFRNQGLVLCSAWVLPL